MNNNDSNLTNEISNIQKQRRLGSINFVLIIAIIALVGYIFYDKFYLNKDEQGQKQDILKGENDNVEKPNDVNIDQIAREIYENTLLLGETSSVPVQRELFGAGYGFDYFVDLYSDKKILINDYYKYEDKMTVAYNKIDKEGKVVEEKNVYVQDENNVSYISFLIEDIKNAYKLYFGKDPQIKDFDNYITGECKVSDQKYICKHFPGGGEGSPFSMYGLYKNSEIISNDLYIYETVVYGDSFENKYYTKVEHDENGNISSKYELTEMNDKDVQDVFSLSSKELSVYKHVFKQNSEGNYYWYSVEPVRNKMS